MPVSMVGRAEELGELAGAWSATTARGTNRARAVVITGGAGVGKSLLTAAALAAFTPRPSVVLIGTARVHTPAPYDWLAAVLSGRRTDDLPVPPDALAWLAQHPDAPRERYAPDALLRLAVRTVRALVGDGPAVLVVEDLHALDPASLNLIGELPSALDRPALLLVTSRPAAAAVAPLLVSRSLARLTGAPGTVRQHLGPLSPDEVAAVMSQVYGGPPDPVLAAAVWQRTGGNPYLLTELLATTGRELIEEAGSALPPDEPYPQAELTAREIEVLCCLAEGMSNKQVARRLGISIRTVAVHVSNLLRKTRSASRTEAALWAVRRELAEARRVS